MTEPIFWLALSFLLVAVCFTVLLVTAVPAFQALGRAAYSVQKLAETLTRELPPTLEAIRLTGLEISELSEELNQGAKSASDAVKQVSDGLRGAGRQARNASIVTRSALAGLKAGWQTLRQPKGRRSAAPLAEPSPPRQLNPTTLEGGASGARVEEPFRRDSRDRDSRS